MKMLRLAWPFLLLKQQFVLPVPDVRLVWSSEKNGEGKKLVKIAAQESRGTPVCICLLLLAVKPLPYFFLSSLFQPLPTNLEQATVQSTRSMNPQKSENCGEKSQLFRVSGLTTHHTQVTYEAFQYWSNDEPLQTTQYLCPHLVNFPLLINRLLTRPSVKKETTLYISIDLSRWTTG